MSRSAAFTQSGVTVSSLALGVLNTVPYKSDAATEQWVLDNVRVMQRMKARVTLLAFFSKGDLYGKGTMNFPGVRAALDAAGYRGWLEIEGVKTPLGVEPSIRYDLDYLRPIFPKTT